MSFMDPHAISSVLFLQVEIKYENYYLNGKHVSKASHKDISSFFG